MVNESRIRKDVHSIYTITISDYSLYEETKDYNYLLINDVDLTDEIKTQIDEFILSVGDFFSKAEVNKHFKTYVEIQIKEHQKFILENIRFALSYGGNEYFLKEFKRRYKINFLNDDHLKLIDKDLEKNEIRLATLKAKVEDNKEGNKELRTFRDTIVSIENTLDRTIDRNLKLYELKSYIDSALQKVSRLEDLKNG